MNDAGWRPERSEVMLTYAPDRDLSLQYTGEEQCEPGHEGQGIRNQFLVHYVLRGSGRVMTASGAQRLGAGDGFLFFPGQRCWYRADDQRPWAYAWVGFAGRQADAAVRAMGFTEERTVWRARPDAALRQCFRRLRREAEESGARQLRLDGLLCLLLDRIDELSGPATGAGRGRLPGAEEATPSGAVARAFRFVELHYGQDIGVSDMARHAGLERTYFSALFKRETGRPPAGYLLAYRMARAEDLLAEGRLSVKEIAFSVGYRDYAVFAKRFRKTHGCTPLGFRRRAAAGGRVGKAGRAGAPAPRPARGTVRPGGAA
jgi:AraC-like DNA-binding protein